MQTVDDIVELADDVPRILRERCEQMLEWDRLEQENRDESDRLKLRLENDKSLTDEERYKMMNLSIEKMELAGKVCEKKVELASRNYHLFKNISDEVHRTVFNCKWELEAEVPGVTQTIEKSFITAIMMQYMAESNEAAGIRSESREDRGSKGGGSSSVSRENTPFDRPSSMANRGSRGNSVLSNRSVSTAPSDVKRKKKTGPAILAQYATAPIRAPTKTSGALSDYMRKKKEKLREQKKLLELHKARQVQTQSQRKIKTEPSDMMEYEEPATPSSLHYPNVGRPAAGGRDFVVKQEPPPTPTKSDGGLLSDNEEDLLSIFPPELGDCGIFDEMGLNDGGENFINSFDVKEEIRKAGKGTTSDDFLGRMPLSLSPPHSSQFMRNGPVYGQSSEILSTSSLSATSTSSSNSQTKKRGRPPKIKVAN